MRVFDVKEEVGDSEEYVLGADQTGSHACYLIYGTMGPKEKARQLKPGRGHEELFLAIKGDFRVTGHVTGTIQEGQAMHLVGEQTAQLENMTDGQAVYVIAGGHSSGGHH
jgi:hypothetical protein